MKHQATPYLMFDRQAKEALGFYEEIFQAEITDLQTYGEADFPTPEEANDLIMHAKIKKGDLLIMVSDTFPGSPLEAGNNISLVLECESESEIQHLYEALCAKGSSLMELQDTFWGAKYGKVKDQFGVQWDLNFTK
ncbi:VOC family protein [Peribacillus muralis]|uniref:VOC family protein n=1 Tax=Peribacillus muralis TaxID=264697 RepID=UPI001F4E8487|nr:VOC family protein [Peribacillus muralis]MCK1994862.1 VOC family protein [Peribacillus muralis]MCK2015311.1 VOC family protein [Peribacillus muralis]